MKKPKVVFQAPRVRIARWEQGNPEGDIKVSLNHPAFGDRIPYVHISAEEAVQMAQAILQELKAVA